MSAHSFSGDVAAPVEALVALSAMDLLYADRYLHRAEVLLLPHCTREQYLALRRDQDGLARLATDLRSAAERSDWTRVHHLARQGAQARARLAASERILASADAVYGPRTLHVEPNALALAGALAQPASNLAETRAAVLDQLRRLVTHDRAAAAFYRERLQHFERLEVVTGEATGPVLDPAELQKRILQAADKGDFEQVERVTASILTSQSGETSARLRAPKPAKTRVQALAAAFPRTAVTRARGMGLALETLPGGRGLNAYLSCCCADRAAFPDAPLSETHRKAEACTCGHACPPEVPASLRDNLDLLLLHPFVSSAGLRYLPWFGPEALLVETFSEAEPAAPSPLLEALKLPGRQGIPRVMIEDALRTNVDAICAALGLDPMEFTVACIPFDAYLRLAPRYGWGQQPLWTHFDGYQVTRETHLRALVGGDVRYGGPDDLCSVDRAYDTERLVARFAVLRRQRFLARETRDA